jgi:hypothetical protein
MARRYAGHAAGHDANHKNLYHSVTPQQLDQAFAALDHLPTLSDAQITVRLAPSLPSSTTAAAASGSPSAGPTHAQHEIEQLQRAH